MLYQITEVKTDKQCLMFSIKKMHSLFVKIFIEATQLNWQRQRLGVELKKERTSKVRRTPK